MSVEIEKNYDTNLNNTQSTSKTVKTTSGVDNSVFENTKKLKAQFQSTLDKQGVLGDIWNDFKNFTTLGLGSSDVENVIENYENGEITYEEALETIENFEEKQEGAVDIISNTASGLITAGVVAAGALTGGAAIAVGAVAGGTIKAGLKTLDRATNEVEGDALDAKEIAKDSISGAVDGAVSIATAGMVTKLDTASITGKSIYRVAAKGAFQGAQAGAISGAATGATQYSLDCAFDEENEFSVDELVKTTSQNALFGGIFGGITGGVTNAIEYKKVYTDTINELHVQAHDLGEKYAQNISNTRKNLNENFDDISSLPEENISARAKSNKTGSIFAKLKSNFEKGKLKSTNYEDCASAIGDGYGARFCLKNLSEDEAKSVVEETLLQSGKTYDDFIYALQNDDELDDVFKTCLEKLKEKQTSELYDRLIELIDGDKIALADDEFNNYGNEITSYFTDEQLTNIALLYEHKTGKSLKIVNNTEVSAEVTKSVLKPNGEVAAEKYNAVDFSQKAIEKANKKSGYPDVQMNIKTTNTTGAAIADTEIQIRGEEVNKFAEIEHLFYDLMQGKVDKNNPYYSEIIPIIDSMSTKTKNEYYSYIKQTYKAKRLKELGISIEEPVLTFSKNLFSKNITQDEIKILSKEGLSELYKLIHK